MIPVNLVFQLGLSVRVRLMVPALRVLGVSLMKLEQRSTLCCEGLWDLWWLLLVELVLLDC